MVFAGLAGGCASIRPKHPKFVVFARGECVEIEPGRMTSEQQLIFSGVKEVFDEFDHCLLVDSATAAEIYAPQLKQDGRWSSFRSGIEESEKEQFVLVYVHDASGWVQGYDPNVPGFFVPQLKAVFHVQSHNLQERFDL